MSRPAPAATLLLAAVTAAGVCVLASGAGRSPVAAPSGKPAELRDVAWFLQRLRTLDHLPQLERSHTALASTWDRSGANADGTDYKRVEGATNVLLDVDGPGCLHRIFTGGSEPGRPDLADYLRVDGTRLQVFLDHEAKPVFDSPVVSFFDPARGPIPAPLVGGKAQGWTYPGCLFPIPYARHCRVQITNPAGRNWGSYWQIAYTTYEPGTRVATLAWPLTGEARRELEQVGRAWLAAQSSPPAPPARWTVERTASVPPGGSLELTREGAGVVRELRLAVEPATAEVLTGLRLLLHWDGEARPSVDVPVGHFFGHAFSGHGAPARFSSLLLGVTADAAYARLPMPYANGARLVLRNDSRAGISRLRVALDVEPRLSLPSDWGRLHATFLEAKAADDAAPRFGARKVPAHLVLEHQGRGKYVGVVMSEDWPHDGWWGEGDWLIWTDEEQWPPRYHGTGSEEYFNSGWCLFDRKAVSGYVAIHPGHPTQYSFHLNDAFQFERNVRVAVETVGWDKADTQIHAEHPLWRTTAFWYSAPAAAPARGR